MFSRLYVRLSSHSQPIQPAALHVICTACLDAGSVAVPIPISSVPAAAVGEAAQRRATVQRPADAVAQPPRLRPAAASQPMVAVAPATAAEQVPMHFGDAAATQSSAHYLPGYAAVPNGDARSAAEPAQPPQSYTGISVAAVSGNTTFESWLDATLPTSQHDAVMSDSRVLKTSVAGANLPLQTNHRWTVAGAADAGCARAAPVELTPGSQLSEPQRPQAPPAVLTPHVMPTWFVPTQ